MSKLEILEILERDGMWLKNVDEQDSALCKAAVQQNGMALQFVKRQTVEICIDAFNNNPKAIEFIKIPSMRGQLLASSI